MKSSHYCSKLHQGLVRVLGILSLFWLSPSPVLLSLYLLLPRILVPHPSYHLLDSSLRAHAESRYLIEAAVFLTCDQDLKGGTAGGPLREEGVCSLAFVLVSSRAVHGAQSKIGH